MVVNIGQNINKHGQMSNLLKYADDLYIVTICLHDNLPFSNTLKWKFNLPGYLI